MLRETRVAGSEIREKWGEEKNRVMVAMGKRWIKR